MTSNSNAPSQAHLQGTQSRHTKANLAKEPALFLRFRNLLHLIGHRYSIQVTKTKGEHTTWVLPKCRLTEAVFQLLFFNLALYPA
jgi:hypothetical protein